MNRQYTLTIASSEGGSIISQNTYSSFSAAHDALSVYVRRNQYVMSANEDSTAGEFEGRRLSKYGDSHYETVGHWTIEPRE